MEPMHLCLHPNQTWLPDSGRTKYPEDPNYYSTSMYDPSNLPRLEKYDLCDMLNFTCECYIMKRERGDRRISGRG